MLKFKLDTLDGLDETTAKLYAKGADGKFTLQVEDDPAKSVIQKLREERDVALKALKEREAKEADTQTAAEKARLEAAGEYEKVKQVNEAEKAALQKKLEHEQTRTRNFLIQSEATRAIAAAKGVPDLLLPHITGQLEVVADGDSFKVTGKGGVPLSDVVEGLRSNAVFGRAFEASASGAGTPPGAAKGGGQQTTMTRQAFEQLPADARMAAVKSGTTITD